MHFSFFHYCLRSWILKKNWLKVWDWKRRNWSTSVIPCCSCYEIKIAFLIFFCTDADFLDPSRSLSVVSWQLSPQMPELQSSLWVGSRKGKCELGEAAAQDLWTGATARPIKTSSEISWRFQHQTKPVFVSNTLSLPNTSMFRHTNSST